MHNPLDSRQLSIFLELANLKNMRKAGKALNLTTSAISHSLKKLEDDLGCKLFDRNSRNITLTYAGQRLFTEAEEILQRLNNARYILNDWSDTAPKTIRIGASSSACQYIIPSALREFKESFPGINIQIISGNSYQLIEHIQDNRVDVAIYPSANSKTQENEISIGTDELRFIVNPMHHWAQREKVDMDKIGQQRIILSESGSYTFDLITGYFRQYRVNLLPFIEISNEEVIKSLVELDIGIGILPEWLIRKEIEEQNLYTFPLGRKKLQRNWVIASPHKKELCFPERLFLEITKNVAQNLFFGLSK